MPIPEEFSLKNRTAMFYVSGGEEAPRLARALSEAGATLFIVSRREVTNKAVLSELVGSGHASCVVQDSSEESITQVMNTYSEIHGAVDILVNDSRSFYAQPFLSVKPAEWEALYERNVVIPYRLSQCVASQMIDIQYGRIVNLVSILAERGMINGSAFSMTQASLLALTRSLAVELGKHNIRVNALGSGWYTAEQVPLEVQQEELLVRYTPLRRKGTPDDMGPLLVYLCSEACDYTTGQPVYVDGGLNAHP